MVFEFDERSIFTQSIDVVDIGNMTLRVTTQDKLEFYLITKTVLGKTAILQFGPIVPDLNILLDNFNMSYQKIDYKEKLICRAVTSLINNPKFGSVTVEEITEFEAFKALPDIEECFMNCM